MRPGAGERRAQAGRTRTAVLASLVAAGALGLATVGQTDRDLVDAAAAPTSEALAAGITPPAFGLVMPEPAPEVALAPAARVPARAVPAKPKVRASRDKLRAATAEVAFVQPVIDSTGIPVTVLKAYKRAKRTVKAVNPVCHISISLLSAVGRVESDHAYGGYLDKNGRTLEPILGPRLDGHPGVKSISDSDNGVYDGDKKYDRAVGPMQFIPTTWAMWATDGNGDKIGDPSNIYDASLSAAWYLCASGADLREPKALKKAILSYNGSENYYKLVLAWYKAYHTALTSIPDSEDAVAARKKAELKAAQEKAASAAAAKAPARAASPAKAVPAAPKAPTQPAVGELIAPKPDGKAPGVTGHQAPATPAGPKTPASDERRPEQPNENSKAVGDALTELTHTPKGKGAGKPVTPPATPPVMPWAGTAGGPSSP